MPGRWLLTISTAAVLTGVYALYALTISPYFTPMVFEGSADAHRASLPAPAPPINREMAAKWLAEYPWVADAKYQVRTRQAFVYAEDWRPVEPSGDIRFKPFALILQREGTAEGKQPLVMVAESALLKFSSRFDMQNPRPGRVIGGALEGEVIVTGADGLTIKGRHVNFSEAALRVWSDHPVEFTFGPNQGTGLGLELDLNPGPPTADKPGVSGIRTVRLRKDVVMKLRSKPRDPGDSPQDVEITSAGTFEFLVDAHMASFKDKVHVRHPTGDNQFDTLDCDDLLLVFEPKPAEPGAAPVTGDAQAETENLQFRRLRGLGAPCVLTSQRSEFRGTAAELTYDGVDRVAVLRDEKLVHVAQPLNELFAPEITVFHEERGQVREAVCRGAGRLASYASDPQRAGTRGPLNFSGSWTRQLRKYPDQPPTLEIIEFEGGVELAQTGQMKLQAEVVKLWLTPDREKRVKPAEQRSTSPISGGSSLAPQRMLAIDGVRFQSAQLRGTTQRLEAWFEDGTLPLTPPPGDEVFPAAATRLAPLAGQIAARGSGGRSAGLRDRPLVLVSGRTPKRGGGLAAVEEEPAGRARVGAEGERSAEKNRVSPAGATGSGDETRRPPMIPLDVTADIIRVRTVRDGDQSHVAEIWNEGSVRVQQPRGVGQPPFQLTGDQLHLKNYSETNQVVRVLGKPGHVEDRGLELDGEDIRLNRGRNDMQVEGAGTLRLPVGQGMDGKQLSEPQKLNVSWKEQMRFNGEVARFYVDVQAELDDSRMTCQEMDVTLTRRISFSEKSAESQKAEVKHVYCRETVDVLSYEYSPSRQLLSLRRAQAWEFQLDQQTGETRAQGPGTLLMWRRGNSNRAGLSATAAVRANRPLQPESSPWEYARIDFAGTMTGNTNDRFTVFKERVRVVYGPVDSSSATIDPDELPKDAGWLRCDALQLTQHTATRQQKAYLDLLGSGNSELEGRTTHGNFHALADSISFDESKGQYLLRSLGNRSATIWRQTKIGAAASRNDAQRMEFIPSENRLKLDRASGVDGLE